MVIFSISSLRAFSISKEEVLETSDSSEKPPDKIIILFSLIIYVLSLF